MYSAYFLYPLAFTVLLVVFLLGHFKKKDLVRKNRKVYILSDCYFYETFFFLYVN